MAIRFYIATLIACCLLQSGCNNDDQAVESNAASSSVESSTTVEETPPENQMCIIDVRTQEEWDGGHLEQAVRISHEDITEQIASIAPDKSAKLVLYWNKGGRAGRAKAALEEMGYTNVESGGFEETKDRYQQ